MCGINVSFGINLPPEKLNIYELSKQNHSGSLFLFQLKIVNRNLMNILSKIKGKYLEIDKSTGMLISHSRVF